jgi:pimeloyl-ACP methyl ester carboxylesterase
VDAHGIGSSAHAAVGQLEDTPSESTSLCNVAVMTPSDLTFTDSGSGRPVLVLHGGGGPFTVAAISAHVATSARAITPTHPGWDGTSRPDSIASIGDLAALYEQFLDELDLHDVLVIGSSLGGWIAADLALRSKRVSSLVLVDAGGIEVPGEPMRDFFALDPRGVAEYSFHDAQKFYVDPSTLPAEQVAARRANSETMRVLAGDPYMHDPTLFGRLGGITVPTLVIWGESDRIFTPGYGLAYSKAIPGARFELVEKAGHLPQLEQPAATFALIDSMLTTS